MGVVARTILCAKTIVSPKSIRTLSNIDTHGSRYILPALATFQSVECHVETMKKRILVLVLILATLLVAAGWTRPDWQTVEVDGLQRRYLVDAPPRRFRGKRPLIIVFHGGGGNARQATRLGFAKLGRKKGYILVYPEGIDGHWYDPRVAFFADDGSRPDDLKFVSKLLDRLEADYHVDTDRVYATGLSNGGIMSHYVGDALSDRFAAIAPVIGGIPAKRADEFRPTSPVSVLIMQGTKDPLVPYAGGHITVFGKKRGKVVSTERTVQMWVEHNQCSPDGVREQLPDSAPGDGCTVERTTYGEGREGSEVILYKVLGGGHTMPGGAQYLPERLIGKVCRDVVGVDIIADFFARHKKR